MDKTNAMRILDQKKIEYKVHTYLNTGAISGVDVAQVWGENKKEVFKTLVTISSEKNYFVFLIPVEEELDLKAAAKSVGQKKIEMLKSKDLLPLTGYIHGGCSPIGMKKFFKTTIDKSASNNDKIIFSGGKIGYQIETTLEELSKVIKYELADICFKSDI